MADERSVNLCSYFILPLIGLNRLSFGDSKNFINSYLTPELTHIIVELQKPIGSYQDHSEYVTDYTKDGVVTIIFRLPSIYRATAAKFKEGKYSQFSSEAKQLIKKKSGLNYKVPNGAGKLHSSKKLLALDKDVELKQHLEKELAVKLGKDAELLSIPDDSEFKEIQLIKVQQG